MKIIGVTSCSTGIAHTYMASEGIKQAAKKLGYKAKVETQGALGIENRLSKKDIEEADLIIMATDVPLREAERFEGVKVYRCETNDFIKNADKSMKKALESIK